MDEDTALKAAAAKNRLGFDSLSFRSGQYICCVACYTICMAKYAERTCSKHGLTKYRYDSGPNSKGRFRCIQCSTAYVSEQRWKKKRVLVDRLGGKCVNCGYSKNLAALDFHHRDPSQKSFALSQVNMASSLDKLIPEADKCDLLCATCHREVEYPTR